MNKYATIFGSVGINIGDDLMNRVLCNACRHYGYIPLVGSTNPEETENTHGEITFPSSTRELYTWIPMIKKSSLVIVGGGTLIQNDFKGKLSGMLIYTSAAIIISKLIFRKRTIAMGLGINKISLLNRFLARSFLLCDEIYVRDETSIKNGKAIGLKKLVKTTDIALCKTFHDHQIDAFALTHFEDSDYICLSLVGENIKDLAHMVGRLTLNFAKGNNLKVKAICMDSRDSEEKSVFLTLKHEFGEIIEIIEPKSPQELVPILSSSSLNIGMRLHFCVLSLVSQQNPVIISRESKTEWIMELFPNSSEIDAFNTSMQTLLPQLLSNRLKARSRFTDKDEETLDECRRDIESALERILDDE